METNNEDLRFQRYINDPRVSKAGTKVRDTGPLYDLTLKAFVRKRLDMKKLQAILEGPDE